MEDLDYWRLCDGLSIVQAALLIASRDPSSDGAYIEGWGAEKRPVGYEAAKTAISNALRRGLIIGKIIPVYEYDVNGNECGQVTDSIDVAKSRIDVDSLRTWLTGRGILLSWTHDLRDYLDTKHPRYAPKLAAAVLAWQATGNKALSGKSPKQALLKWLREHAAEFDLTDEDGKPNETGIEEAAMNSFQTAVTKVT
jgi:hypothetical protein